MRRSCSSLGVAFTLTGLLACGTGPAYQTGDGTGTTTSPGGSTSTFTTVTAATPTTGDDASAGAFIARPDAAILECDLFLQDCPEGQKCTALSGSGPLDTFRCVPVARDPDHPGEPCS